MVYFYFISVINSNQFSLESKKGYIDMGIFDKIDELIDEEEQEKELERERLMELSEKELLVEILLKLEEIKDNQFFYSD